MGSVAASPYAVAGYRGAVARSKDGGGTREVLDLLVGDVRRLVHRHQRSRGQVATRLQGAAGLQQLGVAAHQLGIPHYVLNMERAFQEHVVEMWIEARLDQQDRRHP